MDFCVKPEIPNTLVIMGGGETIFSNSLNECQGDCDTGKLTSCIIVCDWQHFHLTRMRSLSLRCCR